MKVVWKGTFIDVDVDDDDSMEFMAMGKSLSEPIVDLSGTTLFKNERDYVAMLEEKSRRLHPAQTSDVSRESSTTSCTSTAASTRAELDSPSPKTFGQSFFPHGKVAVEQIPAGVKGPAEQRTMSKCVIDFEDDFEDDEPPDGLIMGRRHSETTAMTMGRTHSDRDGLIMGRTRSDAMGRTRSEAEGLTMGRTRSDAIWRMRSGSDADGPVMGKTRSDGSRFDASFGLHPKKVELTSLRTALPPPKWTTPTETQFPTNVAPRQPFSQQVDQAVELPQELPEKPAEHQLGNLLEELAYNTKPQTPQVVMSPMRGAAQVARSPVNDLFVSVYPPGVAENVAVWPTRNIERVAAAPPAIQEQSMYNSGLPLSIIHNKVTEPEVPLTPSPDAAPHGLAAACCPNPGSFGHPALCKRPCICIARGKCSAGASCRFCHMSHSVRAPHLDKRHRDLLQTLPFSQRVAITLPMMQRQLAQHGYHTEADTLIEILQAAAAASEAGEAAQRSSAPTASMLQTLTKALGALSLRALVHAICKAPDTPESLRKEALEHQLDRIRGVGK